MILYNYAKYLNVSKALNDLGVELFYLKWNPILSIFRNGDENRNNEYFSSITVLLDHYTSKQQFYKDNEEINELVNGRSEKIKNHAHKIDYWISSNFERDLESSLDEDIVNNINEWFKARGLSKLVLENYSVEVISDEIDLCAFTLNDVEKNLANKNKKLLVHNSICWYHWQKPLKGLEQDLSKQLELILEKVTH